MAWEKRIEAVLGDMRRDFDLGLSTKKFSGEKSLLLLSRFFTIL